jgi:hypothetical protein
MPKQDKTASVKAVNYTPEMEAVLVAAAPFDLELAKKIGQEIGRSHRSVISKVKSLGLEYVAKKPEPKRITPETKADIVNQLEYDLCVEKGGLKDLAKATTAALVSLREAIRVQGYLFGTNEEPEPEPETETAS